MTSAELPEPIRRRMGLPALSNPMAEQIKAELFRNSHRYIAMILAASQGHEIDTEELLAVAQRAGKCPAIIHHDLEIAMTAYKVWQNSVNP